ncbi:hypothetical protein GCM10010305_12730 [Streptomyces termitum]|uniref:TadE-like domain-containing protein n=2 Tax=Streptomyces termitum TaxID=67368 RepID=A0A918SXE1_9ACTN|nr:hypothetical protein GCM10010305_12730 [Streptomyces termitum]
MSTAPAGTRTDPPRPSEHVPDGTADTTPGAAALGTDPHGCTGACVGTGLRPETSPGDVVVTAGACAGTGLRPGAGPGGAAVGTGPGGGAVGAGLCSGMGLGGGGGRPVSGEAGGGVRMVGGAGGTGGVPPGGAGASGGGARSRTASERRVGAGRRADGGGCDRRGRGAGRGAGRDRGQAAVEYLGFLPLLLIVGLAGLQLGLAAYAAQQAGTAARAAARAGTSDAEDAPSPEAAAAAAVSDWVRPRIERGGGGGEFTVTVTVDIPRVIPFWSFDPVSRTATMPLPRDPEGDDLP